MPQTPASSISYNDVTPTPLGETNIQKAIEALVLHVQALEADLTVANGLIGKNTTDIGELRNDVGEDLPAPGSLRYSVNKNAEAIGTLRYDVGKTLAPLPGSLLFRVGENEGAITSLEATVGSGPTDSDTLSFWVDYLRRNLSESLLPTINSIRNFVGWETGLQPGTLGYQVNEHDEAIVRHEAMAPSFSPTRNRRDPGKLYFVQRRYPHPARRNQYSKSHRGARSACPGS